MTVALDTLQCRPVNDTGWEALAGQFRPLNAVARVHLLTDKRAQVAFWPLQHCCDAQTAVLLMACLGNSRGTCAGTGGNNHHSTGRMAVCADPQGAQAVAGAQQQ